MAKVVGIARHWPIVGDCEAIERALDEGLLVNEGLHGLAEVGLGEDRPYGRVVEVEDEVGDPPVVPNVLLCSPQN